MDRIEWGRPKVGEPASPFLGAIGQRPLRITFHSSSFDQSEPNELRALTALRALMNEKEIDALSIYDGVSPIQIVEPLGKYVWQRHGSDEQKAVTPIYPAYVQLSGSNRVTSVPAVPHLPTKPLIVDLLSRTIFHSEIPVEYEKNGRRGLANTTESALYNPERWLTSARSLCGEHESSQAEVARCYRDLLDAEAHRALDRDILITLSPWLLGHQPWLKRFNALRPSDALRLVGLFLRRRNIYAFNDPARGVIHINQGMFYSVLAIHRLPHLWSYIQCCVLSGPIRSDDTGALGYTIVSRASRVLRERDNVGFQFYIPQNNDTRDEALLHFDNLIMHLAGALDAQAIIAFRAYDLSSQSNSKSKENNASFRRDRNGEDREFLKALSRTNATRLYSLVTSQGFQDALTLLYDLRNTIHRAQLAAFAYEDWNTGRPMQQQSLVTVPGRDWPKIREAAHRCGGLTRWGLRDFSPSSANEGVFEPYTYSLALVDECFKLIDAVAELTDTAGLFPQGHDIPQIQPGPPPDGPYKAAYQENIGIVGW